MVLENNRDIEDNYRNNERRNKQSSRYYLSQKANQRMELIGAKSASSQSPLANRSVSRYADDVGIRSTFRRRSRSQRRTTDDSASSEGDRSRSRFSKRSSQATRQV